MRSRDTRTTEIGVVEFEVEIASDKVTLGKLQDISMSVPVMKATKEN